MKIRTRNNKNNKIQTSLILNYSRRRTTRIVDEGKRGKKKKADPREVKIQIFHDFSHFLY